MKLIIIYFITSLAVFSQSIDEILRSSDIDSIKIKNLIVLSNNSRDKTIALQASEKAKQLSEYSNIDLKKRVILNLADKKTKYLQFAGAIETLYELYTLAERENDPRLAITFYKKIGNLYLKMSSYGQATEYFILGLKYSEDQMYYDEKSFFAQNLAKLNYELKNYQKSIDYYLSSLEIGIEIEDYNIIANAKLGLGRAYFNINDYKRSEENLLSSLKLSKHFSSDNSKALAYNYLAKIFEIQKDKRKAQDYFDKAISFIDKSIPNDVASEVYVDMGKYFQNSGKKMLAIEYLEIGFDIANELDNLYLQKKSCEALAHLYEFTGDYEKATQYLKINQRINDQIFEVGRQKNISEALVEYETGTIEKKNLELETRIINQEAEKQRIENVYLRNLLIFTILLSVAVFISFVIYYRYRTKNKANKILQKKNLEIESLNSQLMSRNNEIQKINSELTLSEQNLKESNAAKDKFFSIIAHDLKNPISGLLLATDLIITYYNDLSREQIVDKIKELNQTSKNLRTLLENLLEWARTQTKSIEYEPTSFSILELINNVKDLFNQNISQKNLVVVIAVKDQLVFADKKMIETVIRNIISNSLKFTPNGGNIKVESSIDNEYINLTFEDNGIGIPKDKLEEIFDVTSTFSTLGTNKEKGTGLGLTLCKEFIEINKGDIKVESIYGEFTRFMIKIPLKNE